SPSPVDALINPASKRRLTPLAAGCARRVRPAPCVTPLAIAIPPGRDRSAVTAANPHDFPRRRPALFPRAIGFAVVVLFAAPTAQARPGVPEHAIAMHGEPAFPAG